MADDNQFFKWGDYCMILAQRVNGEYCDIQGQFRGLALRGSFKGMAQVVLLGSPQTLHIDPKRLWNVDDYFKRYNKDKGLLPPGSCGVLFKDLKGGG